LDEEILDYFKGLELPTAAAKMEFADKLSALIHEDILQVRSLSPGFFRPRILRKVFFKSFKRKALVIPENLAIIDKGRDEVHPNRKKITISFFLPRGSYGTMLIKRATL
jgi:tRNA pseudouridine13 synthase